MKKTKVRLGARLLAGFLAVLLVLGTIVMQSDLPVAAETASAADGGGENLGTGSDGKGGTGTESSPGESGMPGDPADSGTPAVPEVEVSLTGITFKGDSGPAEAVVIFWKGDGNTSEPQAGTEGRTEVSVVGSGAANTVSLEKDVQYQYVIRAEGYVDERGGITPGDTANAVAAVEVKREVKVQVSVKCGDTVLKSASVTCDKAIGEISGPDENGNFTLTLKEDDTDIVIGAACPGFSVTGTETLSSVAAGQQPVELSADLNNPLIELPEGVTVSGNGKLDIFLGPDKELQLGIENQCSDVTYTWSSSDAAIAGVDEKSGLVTGKAVGEATITLTAAVGSSEKTAEQQISVKKTVIAAPASLESEESTGIKNTDVTDVAFVLAKELEEEKNAKLIIEAAGGNLENTKETTILLGNGQNKVTWEKINGEAPLGGKITYTFQYESDNYISPETSSGTLATVEMTYYATPEWELRNEKDSEIAPDEDQEIIIFEMTYGDTDRKLKLYAGGSPAGDVDYKVTSGNAVAVNQDGIITINHAGEATITVSREADDTNFWPAYSQNVTVKVAPKPIDLLKDVVYENSSKIYDGTDQIEAKGSFQDAKVFADDEAAVKVTLILPSKNTGDYLVSDAEPPIQIARERDADGNSKPKAELTGSSAGNYVIRQLEEQESWAIQAGGDKDSKFSITKRTICFQIVSGKNGKEPDIVQKDGKTVVNITYDRLFDGKALNPEAEELLKADKLQINITGMEGGTNTGPVNDTDKEDLLKELRIVRTSNPALVLPGSGPGVNVGADQAADDKDITDVGRYQNAFTVQFGDANTDLANNYVISDSGNSLADLDVGQEILNDEVIDSIVSYQGSLISVSKKEGEKKSTVYVKADGEKADGTKIEGGSLNAVLQEAYANRYDAILCKDKDGNLIDLSDLTGTGITAGQLQALAAEGQKREIPIRLAKKTSSGGYKNYSSEIRIPYKLDSLAPEVEEQDPSEVANPVDVVTSVLFKYFKNDNDKVLFKFTVQDPRAASGDKDGSGVESVKAYVWKLTKESLTDIDKGAVKAKVESLKDEDWKTFTVTSDGSYMLELPKSEKGGSYLVLVEAADKTNNIQVYASNGIVIDITKPEISVCYDFLEKDYYNGDINYFVTVTDPVQDPDGLGVSGIAKLTWEVFCNEKAVDVNSGVWLPENSDTEEEVKTEKLKDEELKTGIDSMPLVIKVKNEEGAEVCNSNDILLKITAWDRAGNEAAVYEKALKIDATKPKVSVSYDNNAAKNGKYFKAERTATIVFTERNFDKNNVVFDLKLEDDPSCRTLTVKDLSEQPGIRVEWGEDSQAGFDPKAYTDARTNTLTIYFEDDNAYSGFVPHCTDLAGNSNEGIDYPEGTAAPTDFIIDKTAPVISMKYTVGGREISVGKTEAGRVYHNQNIRAAMTVAEHNFAVHNDDGTVSFTGEQGVTYTVAGTDADGKTVKLADYQTQAAQAENWSGGDEHQSGSFVFDADANYTASFAYTDLAGNSAKWEADYFTVDKTLPEGVIHIRENAWNTFFDRITFGVFAMNTLSVEMEKSDATSPTRAVEYLKSWEPMTMEELEASTAWQTADRYMVSPNEQFIPYMRVTDYAGNVRYISADTRVIVDNTPISDKDTGKPIITITTSEPEKEVYDGDVSFTINVEDPEVNRAYSGISEVTWRVLRDGETTQTDTYRYAGESHVKDMNAAAVIQSALNNSNDVKIAVRAADNAGNITEEELELKIDITKPVIEIVFDNNQPLQDKYYKDVRTATVTVTERNFDEGAFQTTITNTDGVQPSVSGWSHSADSGISDSATHTCTITFSADGDYTLSAVCRDLAGNESEAAVVEEFTVDRTIPVLSVSYDLTESKTPGYFKEYRTATVTVQEHNFDPAGIEEQISAMLEGTSISAPSIQGWSTQGDYHTATIAYEADGDYTFDIAYTDMAGNAAEAYEQERFTVDTTAPEVRIDLNSRPNGDNKLAYGDEEVTPQIFFSDINQDADGVEVHLTNMRNANAAVDAPYSTSSGATDTVCSYRDFAHVKDMDGLYVLRAAMTDKAGNMTEEEVTFSVNRFGAYYILSDETRNLVDGKYTNQEEDVVLTEYSLSTIPGTASSVYYTRDGQSVDLEAGRDYERSEVSRNGWNEYTYRIDAKNFEEEGGYDVAVESLDSTGNRMTNKINRYTEDDSQYNAEISFIVDKTSPSVSVNDLDEERYTENSHDALVIATDNIGVWAVDVYCAPESSVHGEIEDSVNAAWHFDDAEGGLRDAHGELPITIAEANEYQVVKAVATDIAGNVMGSEEYRVLVTSNAFVQFYNNTPLFVGSIAGAALLAGAVILLIAAKRRKKNRA